MPNKTLSDEGFFSVNHIDGITSLYHRDLSYEGPERESLYDCHWDDVEESLDGMGVLWTQDDVTALLYEFWIDSQY